MKRILYVAFANVTLAALLLVAAFGVVEIYYRTTWSSGPLTVGGYLVEDDTYNHVLAPGYETRRTVHPDVPPFDVRTNALGLRYEREYATKKAAGTTRVVVRRLVRRGLRLRDDAPRPPRGRVQACVSVGRRGSRGDSRRSQ